MSSPVLRVSQITKVFSRPVLENISFKIEAGETVALVGSNGAGKSTFLKCLMGLIHPERGEIHFFGNQRISQRSCLRRTAFLPELVSFWPEATAREILELSQVPRNKIQDVLSEVGLDDRANSRVGEFSKGMVQRLGLASLLLKDPDFLVLDEPMTGLDFRAQEWLRSFLATWKKKEKTMLISTHSLRDVELLADRVLVLEQGKLLRDGAKEIVLPELYQFREKMT